MRLIHLHRTMAIKSTVNGMFYFPPSLDPEMRKMIEEMHRRILNLEIDMKDTDHLVHDVEARTKKMAIQGNLHF